VAPRFAQGQDLAPGHVAQPDWWAVFDDPALDLLVRRGLEANLDLQQAAERVQRSRGLAAGAQAERGPSGGVGLGVRAQQLSRFEAPGASADDRRSESGSARVSLSWEVDLFGRLRHAAQAADARLQAVQADAAALEQALDNLVSNAIDAMPQGGELRLSITERKGRLELQVADTGVGIAADDLPHLFQPFRQVGDPARRGGGTGLGLMISRQLVRAMGGEIEVPTLDGREARVSVPEGTQTGKQFRLKNKGMPVLRSSQLGDMYIQVAVETPVNLSRRQKELLKEFEKEAKNNSPESEGFFAKAKAFWDGFGS